MTSNNRSKPLFVAAALATMLAGPRAADASLARAATFDQKVDNAAAIVLGKVKSTRSAMDPTGRFVVTYATFDVEKTMKGSAPQELTVVLPGGTVGNVHQETIGIPEFRTGDEHVLFTRNTELGPTVLYFEQGKYDVGVDDQGQKIVRPGQIESVIVDQQRGMAVESGSVNDVPRRLEVFENDVRTTLRSGAARNQMKALQLKNQQQPPSLWSTFADNGLLIGLAIAGLAFATWQWLRRS